MKYNSNRGKSSIKLYEEIRPFSRFWFIEYGVFIILFLNSMDSREKGKPAL